MSDEEEELLVRFLLKCASIGYPLSRKEVIGMVQNVCDKKGLIVEVTHGWWEGFCHRHPNISLRSTSSLSYSRATATDSESLSTYFDILEDTLDEYKLRD